MQNNHDKKKILVTASTFPRWKDDTEPRFILDLSKELMNYFDVTVLAPACPNAMMEEILEGVKVIRYHYFPVHKWETLCYPGAIVPRIKEKKIRGGLVPFLFIGLWLKLLRISKEYDFIHAHWIIPQGIVQSFFRTPYLLTGHGGDVMELNKFPISILKKRALKKAKAVTVVSPKLRKKVEEKYDIHHIAVQSMGCDIKKFTIKNRVPDYFDQGNKKVILFVGRFVKIKGIEYIIDAMKTVDAMLVLVGNGPEKESIEERAAAQSNKIVFLGSKTHEELMTIYASSDIFVLPSITLEGGVTEGTPTVIAEAMASGLPVIATDTGGIAEIVKDKSNGFLVKEKSAEDLSEKINFILENEKVAKEMAASALETAAQYDYAVIAKRFAEILCDI